MKINGSQNLSAGPRPAPPAGAPPASGAAAPARDALALSGGGVRDGLTSLKESLRHLFDWLLGRRPAPPAPAAEKPPAEKPLAAAPAAPGPARPEPAAAAAVREKAEAIWFKAHALTSAFRTGLRDAHDVNEADDDRDRQARALVAANGPLESERLAGLTDEQRRQYDALAAGFGERPQARLALQVLLAEGKLTARPPAGDADLLTTLHGIQGQAFAPGVEPRTFLAELVHEIAVPSAINQHDKATCTVASVQMLTAGHHPAEYARVVAGLASPEGQVTLASGARLAREPGTEADDGSGRTASTRLWQAAFMQFAVGPEVDYDNDADARNDGRWGVFAPELDRTVDALTGRDTPLLTIEDMPAAEVVRAIGRHANAGKPVPVCMDWGERDASGDEHPGHDILVTAIRYGQVFYDNPWGYQERMSVAEFEARVWWANPVAF